jgi:GDP-L-fucose synthase
MSKVLVTGGAGLIGSAIGALNDPDCVLVSRKEADLRDVGQTHAMFAKIRPRAVIHLAARVAGIGAQMSHPAKIMRENLLIDLNVLEAARDCGVQKLVSVLSTCVFPDSVIYPLNEKSIHDGPPHPSNFGFAYAKRMLEVQTRSYRKEWGCNFVTVVGTNIYGPGDNWSLEDGHVLPALVHRCFLAKQRGQDLIVWGTGAPLREFVYSEDVANLLMWALHNYEEESPLILTSARESSIRELVNLVAIHLKFDGNVIWDETKPDGQLRKPSDPAKLRRYLPDFHFTDIESGVQKTVDWFTRHYPDVRE